MRLSCVKPDGFSLIESLLVGSLLLTFLFFILMPIRSIYVAANRNAAAQQLIVDLQTARARSRLTGQPLVFTFNNSQYSQSIGNYRADRLMPFVVTKETNLFFDNNGFPLVPATVTLIYSGHDLKLVLSKQGRVRYE